MTLSDLPKYSMTRSVAQSLCESWASCMHHRVELFHILSFIKLCWRWSICVSSYFMSRTKLVCAPAALWFYLFLIYCADVIAVASRYGLGVYSYFNADPAETGVTVLQLVTCVEEISQWMSANRLKLNKDKTQFIWLGARLQLSKVQCQKVTMGGPDIQISTEAMCLWVLLDSKLTFALHVRRLSGRCFYHLRQMRTVRRSLTEDAANTMVHCVCYKSNWLLQQCYFRFKCRLHSTCAKCTRCSCSTCVAPAEVWP